jgi:hypothetical protein
MITGPLFERFLEESPLSVMARATVEHALSAGSLDALFETMSVRGSTRELLFSMTVDLMRMVVCDSRNATLGVPCHEKVQPAGCRRSFLRANQPFRSVGGEPCQQHLQEKTSCSSNSRVPSDSNVIC